MKGLCSLVFFALFAGLCYGSGMDSSMQDYLLVLSVINEDCTEPLKNQMRWTALETDVKKKTELSCRAEKAFLDCVDAVMEYMPAAYKEKQMQSLAFSKYHLMAPCDEYFKDQKQIKFSIKEVDFILKEGFREVGELEMRQKKAMVLSQFMQSTGQSQ